MYNFEIIEKKSAKTGNTYKMLRLYFPTGDDEYSNEYAVDIFIPREKEEIIKFLTKGGVD